MSPYLNPFLTALIASLSLSVLLSFLHVSNRRSGSRHKQIHHASISRLGGLAIIGAFFLAVSLDQHLVMVRPFWGLLVSALFILLFGMADDFFELDWKTQLLFQVTLGMIAYFSSIRIDFVTNPFGGIIDFTPFSGLSFLMTLAWLVLIMNAVNWLDGADGLLGGVGGIAAIAIFCISLRPEVNQPPIAILSAILLGSIVGFLVLNIPPARILAGTTGSIFIGFSLAVLAVIAGSKIATTLLVLALPIIDALLVVFRRIFSGDSVFQADERHIHFRLMRLGWSPSKIFLAVIFFTASVALVALQASSLLKAGSFLLLWVIFFWTYCSLDRVWKGK